GEYEVVCAVDSLPGAGENSERCPTPAAVPYDKLSQEVSVLRRQMERLSSSLARSGAAMSTLTANPGLATTFARLTEAELDADLAYEVILRMGTQASDNLLAAELGKLVTVDPALGKTGSGSRIVALVGPPGSGKSSCVAKLAVQFGVAARRPCHLLTV